MKACSNPHICSAQIAGGGILHDRPNHFALSNRWETRWKDVQIEYEVAPKRTSVPGAVRIVIFCKSLDTTMRLTGRRIRKQRLDLASTTLYGYSELASWLESRGFRLVWRAKAAAIGLFLLRRRQ